MAYTLISNTTTSGVDGGTTGDIDTSGANLIVVGVTSLTGTAFPTVSDNKSNSWNSLTVFDPLSQCKFGLVYAWNAIVGGSHNFTIASTTSFSSCCVAAFAGGLVSGDPFDQQNGNAAVVATTVQPGSVTPGVNNEIVITMVGFVTAMGGGFPTINGGFTITNTEQFVGGNNYGTSMAYLIQTTAAAANPTWTRDGASQWGSSIATFKAGVAAPGGFGFTLLGVQ